MKVIDHEPQTWFLLEDAGVLFLDGNYNHSFTGYDWMIQLSADEMDRYRQRGRDFISWLAEDVQNSAPILEMSDSSYKPRRVSSALYAKASAAIKEWQEAARQAT
jgi:hypothetical protein